jgi:hypothetical protein
MNSPETRPSLLLRIRDADDRDAWEEFTDLYRPVICRVARLKGLLEADAEDLAQQVLLSVAGAIEGWKPDAGCRMPDAGCRMPDAGCRSSKIPHVAASSD